MGRVHTRINTEQVALGGALRHRGGAAADGREAHRYLRGSRRNDIQVKVAEGDTRPADEHPRPLHRVRGDGDGNVRNALNLSVTSNNSSLEQPAISLISFTEAERLKYMPSILFSVMDLNNTSQISFSRGVSFSKTSLA